MVSISLSDYLLDVLLFFCTLLIGEKHDSTLEEAGEGSLEQKARAGGKAFSSADLKQYHQPSQTPGEVPR